MNEQGKISGWYSWPVIILALFIFWPVGIFLLIKRISADRKMAMSTGGKGMKGLGIGLFAFGAIGFIGCASDFDFGGCVVALFFVLGGLALIIKAKKLGKEAESMKQYLSIIVNGNVRSLDAISSTTGKSYDVVRNDIENMINKGYLKNAYINEGTREVVLPDINVYSNTETGESVVTTNVTKRVVACPCCGANNTIAGEIGECEYCGSPLK